MILSIDNLNFSYSAGSQQILRDFCLDVEEGEFVSLLGPSGCGKSTLLNILAGILLPDSGGITVNGEPVRGTSSHFAYMPQSDLLLPWKTILDNVCLYGEIHGSKKSMVELARSRMSMFGLEGCENKYPDELSGGMRQRAAFLRTTLCDADIFLLDEPFGALDVITREGMQDWLTGIAEELGKTILLVTHDTDEAIYLSDRILILGRPGEGIRDTIRIEEKSRDREWLYGQGVLRSRIHTLISSGEEA